MHSRGWNIPGKASVHWSMFSAKTAIRHGPKLGASWPNWHRRGMVTEADVEQARKYCENQLRWAPRMAISSLLLTHI